MTGYFARTLRTASCAALAAGLLAPSLVHAAEQAESANQAAQGQPVEAQTTNNGVADIVVTAQKREQSLLDVPISVSVLGAQELARSSIKTVSDLPQLAPALTFTAGAQPAFSTLSIRGAGSYVYRIGVQPSVSVVVDGVPYARTSESVTELGDVERAEVLSGPQGTLFGRNSTGGIVNVTRAAPTSEFGGYVTGDIIQGRLGDTYTYVRGVLNVPVSEGVRARVYAFHKDNDAFIKNLHPDADDYGSSRTYGVQAKLAFDLGPDVTLTLSGDYLKARDQFGVPVILAPIQQYQQPNIPNITAAEVALQTPEAIGNPFKVNVYSPYGSRQRFAGTSATLAATLSDSIDITSVTAYRDNKVEGISPTNAFAASARDPRGFDLLSSLPSSFVETGIARRTRWHYFTHETRFQYTSSFIDATAGVFYFELKEEEFADNPNVVSARSLGQSARVGAPDGPSAAYPYYFSDTFTIASDTNKVYAGFVDVTAHPLPNLDVFGGYRLSRESLDFKYFRQRYNMPIQFGVNFDQNTFLPTVPSSTPNLEFAGKEAATHYAARAGLSYEFVPRTRAYFTYSHGYVGAGVDLGNGSTGTPGQPLNAVLRPSKADSYELGLKTALFDNRLRLSISAFKSKTKDTQVTALVPGTNINVVQNAGDIDAKGVEVNIDARMASALDFHAGISYLDAKIRNLSQPCYPNQANDPDAPRPCVGVAPNRTQSVDGTRALNAPEFKLNAALTYTIEEALGGWDVYLRPDMRYQTRVFYQLDHDPFATQPAFAVFNFSVGFTSPDERYDVRLFVNNIGNKFFCNNMVNSSVGRQACQSPSEDAQRRVGASFRANF